MGRHPCKHVLSTTRDSSPFTKQRQVVPLKELAAFISGKGPAIETRADTTTYAANVDAVGTPSSPAAQITLKKENHLLLSPSQVQTPVNANRLASFLKGYPLTAKNTLIKGFTSGFRIPSTIANNPISEYTNHKSAIENPSVMLTKLSKELKLGRIAGPFTEPPFHDLVTSPLGLVPKKGTQEFRLIHDLSFPKQASVNSHIDPVFSAVHYQDLDYCVSLINKLGPNCLIAKADLKDAFRIIPINKEDHRLLGFQWEGAYYYDKCLPMGCSVSCHIFESLSKSLEWILKNKLSVKYMSHILDDFIFFGPANSSVSAIGLQAFFLLARSINLPIKDEKTVLPTTCASLHGIEVDTSNMTLRLPQDKLREARLKVSAMAKRKKATLNELQSLLGTLNFACRVVVPGRAFLRRLFDLTKGLQKKHHKIRLTREARADLRAWSSFLDNFNGRVMCLPEAWESSKVLKLFSDASGKAYAAVLGHQWIQGSFPEAWLSKNIAVKELLPIALALRLWGPKLANKRIIFMTDNEAIVAVINHQSSKHPELMSLVRSLVMSSLQNNILFIAKHIPGRHNVIADFLSRYQVAKALKMAPWLDPQPLATPPEWLPW